MRAIDEVYTRAPFYGSRRMRLALKDGYGVLICRDHVRRLTRVMGIEAMYPRRKRGTSVSDVSHEKYPYLLGGLAITRPSHVWGVDITYVRFETGWAYLTAILDWFSRYVLAWELSLTLDVWFCIAALERTFERTIPEIHNSDQGAQYTSEEYTSILKEHQVKISMDGRGRCMDNIFTERLWRTVKYEDIYLKSYRTIDEARQGLTEYFTFYNTKRRHQSLQYKTPEEVYFRW